MQSVKKELLTNLMLCMSRSKSKYYVCDFCHLLTHMGIRSIVTLVFNIIIFLKKVTFHWRLSHYNCNDIYILLRRLFLVLLAFLSVSYMSVLPFSKFCSHFSSMMIAHVFRFLVSFVPSVNSVASKTGILLLLFSRSLLLTI